MTVVLTLDELDMAAHIRLDPGQEPFAGGALSLLFDRLRGQEATSGAYPFAIQAFGEVVGFVLLRGKPALPSWAPTDAVTLHNLRIDRDQQGRGFARQAIKLLLAWAATNLPTAMRMALCVNERNEHAHRIYLACGFTDTGQVHEGALGPQAILVCALRAAGPASNS